MRTDVFDLDIEYVPAETEEHSAELTQEMLDTTTLSPITQGPETLCRC